MHADEGEPEGGRPLGRLKRVLEGVNWIVLAEKRKKWSALLNTFMSLQVL